jgi:AcrR family transcriptional regulator
MARRGQELREHILWTAKDVFIEEGFDRTSMDVVAARAETSKRSLYAHFPSKDVLFQSVLELARELYLGRLKTPADYGEDPAEAVVAFCGRFLQLQLWSAALRTFRLGVGEAERRPEAAALYFEAIFEIPQQRLAAYITDRYQVDAEVADEAAKLLFGRAVYPELVRALFGRKTALPQRPEEESLAEDVDLESLRAAAARLLPPAPANRREPSRDE